MSRNRAKIFVGDGSAELAREISREIVVSRTTVSENRTEKTTAILHTENTPAIKKTLNLMRAVDARATFTTNIPLYLILLGTLELAGAYRPLLHILSLVYLIGNVFQTECTYLCVPFTQSSPTEPHYSFLSHRWYMGTRWYRQR